MNKIFSVYLLAYKVSIFNEEINEKINTLQKYSAETSKAKIRAKKAHTNVWNLKASKIIEK